jgi:propanol-preferring alcohol dehydrogenase
MRALQMVEFQREPELMEIPEPKPGPGEVVVKVGGAGACHSDLHVLYEMDVSAVWQLPMTLGHETAGWVHAMGEGVTGLAEGDPVAVYGAWGCGRCQRCTIGMENYCEITAGWPTICSSRTSGTWWRCPTASTRSPPRR